MYYDKSENNSVASEKPKRYRGDDARTHVLHVRLTAEQHARIMRIGGSAWAREILAKASKVKR